MKALLLVDIQPDFCPGGALAVPGGDAVVPVANALAHCFPVVVGTQDFHPPGHSSFRAQGGPWPDHCVQGTAGAAIHPDLQVDFAAIFPKGTRSGADSYSGFQDDDGVDTGLGAWLARKGIDGLVVMGLATDYCVKATVLHALERGLSVEVVREGCRAVEVQPGDGERAMAEMLSAGAQVISVGEVRP